MANKPFVAQFRLSPAQWETLQRAETELRLLMWQGSQGDQYTELREAHKGLARFLNGEARRNQEG